MRKPGWFAALVLAASLLGSRAAAQDKTPTITDAAVGSAVADRQLQAAADSFPATVGTLYCLTRITYAEPNTQMEHVWYHGDTEVARVSLKVGAVAWRTYSSKTIPPEATGDWHVDVVYNGNVLKTVKFTVR